MTGSAEWSVRTVLRDAWRDGRSAWSQLLAVDIGFKLLAFVLLTPLFGLVLRAGVAFSGESVLADQDILLFLVRPIGLVVLVVATALFLALMALEQAGLMTMAIAAGEGKRLDMVSALHFALRRSWAVVNVAVRLVARCLVVSLPFLLGVGLIYGLLLGDYDINYYLSERPSAFVWAVALVGALCAGLASLLVPRLIGWCLALPLVLFEGTPPAEALQESRRRVEGHRLPVARILVLWGVASFALSVILPGAVLAFGRWVGPLGRNRVGLVLALMLTIVVVWAIVNALVSWVASSAFALLVVGLYRQFGGGREMLAQRLASGKELAVPSVGLSVPSLLAGLLAIAVVVGGLNVYLLERLRGTDDFVVVAHRGASGVAPENTMAAVVEALEQETDQVEIDVQETAEGEVVVFHDSDFMKVASDPLKIWDATSDGLSRLDIGSWFDPKFSSERVPTLREVLQTTQGRATLNIELKYYGHDQNLEQRVIDIVEDLEAVDEVVLMSLKYDAVRKLKELRPRWTVGLLTATAVGDLTTLEVDFLAVNSTLATHAFVRRAHRRGRQVYAWTVNDPVQMFRMMNRGVDGLITDEPALAKRVIERRAELSTAERLLVGLAFAFGAAAPDPPASNDGG